MASKGQPPKTVRRKIMRVYDHTCAMCGIRGYEVPHKNGFGNYTVEPHNYLSVDHIVPLSAGGTNDPSNLQILCIRCNSTKGKKPMGRGPFAKSSRLAAIARDIGSVYAEMSALNLKIADLEREAALIRCSI